MAPAEHVHDATARLRVALLEQATGHRGGRFGREERGLYVVADRPDDRDRADATGAPAPWSVDRDARRARGTAPAHRAGRLAGERRPVWDGRRLVEAVDDVHALELDVLSLGGVEEVLGAVTVAIRRLQAAQTALVGAAQTRRASSASAVAGGGSDRAERQTARYLADTLHVPPGEARRTARTARRMDQAPELARRFASGDLAPEHAAAITAVLPDIPQEQRARVEAALVALAATATPHEVAREGRRRVALADPVTAHRRERARHLRRRAT